MISSVVYTPLASQLQQGSTFEAAKSPLFQIIFAKAVVILLIFLLGDLLSQQLACVFVTISSGLEFWITKNMGRRYLQASWSIDTTGEEQVWVYEANFRTPSTMEEVFWYSQVIYGAVLLVAGLIMLGMAKYSLLCAVIIASVANYVNFFAFSKIISLRNAGVLDQIAEDVKAQGDGEIRETIRLPMVHRKSQIGVSPAVMSYIRSSMASVIHA